ncbi:LytR/AlgR family response regulator transcription factor [Companilactobacillus nodensis]|uniref:LytR/AlgR family response regulator transcription factor n=1 Tax=Companilactobacillus nodensis TaxID=460870 RepID=UPI0004698031|nr:LytTR family DNA-binding domain-containing protein [Companilactobacillus nodensis]
MLNVAICEDNLELINVYRLIFKNYMKDHPEHEMRIVISTGNPTEFENYIKYRSDNNDMFYLIDIEFADSQTKGIDLAEEIRKHDATAKIVFITTHEELAYLTFKRKIEPLDYIKKEDGIKSMNDSIYKDLDLTFQRLHELNSQRRKMFHYSLGSRDYTIDVADINYLETSSSSHKVFLHTLTEITEFRGNLNTIEEEFASLYRAHKSILVNLDNIHSVDSLNKMIYFNDGSSCEVSRRKLPGLKRKMAQ